MIPTEPDIHDAVGFHRTLHTTFEVGLGGFPHHRSLMGLPVQGGNVIANLPSRLGLERAWG